MLFGVCAIANIYANYTHGIFIHVIDICRMQR